MTYPRARVSNDIVYRLRFAHLALVCLVPACVGVAVDDDQAIDDGSETGGTTGSGGDEATGGSGNNGMTGGTSSTGGASTGGGTSTGGNQATGGAASTGGTSATGGAASTGGTSATGGAASTGGASATGGTSATGGAASTGGSSATGGADPGGCIAMAPQQPSKSLDTTGAGCFEASAAANGWGAYNCDDRIITINGTVVLKGELPWPGSAPFIIEFSPGSMSYCGFSYY